MATPQQEFSSSYTDIRAPSSPVQCFHQRHVATRAGEIPRGLSGKPWRAGAAELEIGARAREHSHNLWMTVDNGQHDSAQTIFRRLIQPRATTNQHPHGAGLTRPRSDHQSTLAVS